MNLENLTEEFIKNALLGSILADGSLGKQRTDGSRNGTNADLEFTHTSKNLDYLKFKKTLLSKIGIESNISEHNKKVKEKVYTLFRLHSKRNYWLTEVRNALYDSYRIKKFPKEVIENFNSLSLLLMYLDDGTLRIRYYEGTSKIREIRVTFCLDSFLISEINYFRDWLKTTYDIDTKIYRHSKMEDVRRGYRVWMNTQNTLKFMNLIDEYYNMIPSMNYKFVKYYSM